MGDKSSMAKMLGSLNNTLDKLLEDHSYLYDKAFS